ncbi:hypothetical protein TI39_contig950g00009 [Zymoseptoria brevis]|uniref:Uncharacterized protein n=1 Tax=Zymoseptoria brevis TaxID=1047168 RepID=A0A0F4GER1_9PEZI|nr:hypothetical protein TI39_contig950g00009 [Zymoseptoria brevis]
MAPGHTSHARPRRRDSGYSQQGAPDHHGKNLASIAETTARATASQVVEPDPDSDEDAPGELDDDPEFSSHPAPNVYTQAVAAGPSSPGAITPAAPPVRVVLIPPTPISSTGSNNQSEKRSSSALPTTTRPQMVPEEAMLLLPGGGAPTRQSTIATNSVSTSYKSTGPRPKPSSPPSNPTIQHPLPPQPTHPIFPLLPPTSTPSQLFTHHPPSHPAVIKVSSNQLLASMIPFPTTSPFHRLLSPNHQLDAELDRQEDHRRKQHAKWKRRLETRWVWRERRKMAWERGLRPRAWVGPVESGSGGVEQGG